MGDNIVGKCVGKPCIVVTATAAGEDRRRLSGDLRLLKPEVVVGDPNRPNILYEIRKRPPSTEVEDHVKEVFTPIAEQLKDQKLSFPQTILYTDTNIVGLVYDIFDEVLGAEQYIKAPFIPENRIFAQHHRTYTPNMKVGIVAELTKEDSILRFVIATPDSMGLGLNAAHIRLVIHYKPSNSLPQYFQETGR